MKGDKPRSYHQGHNEVTKVVVVVELQVSMAIHHTGSDDMDVDVTVVI